MTVRSTYAEQWQEYRRRRIRFRVVLLVTTLFWLGGGALFAGWFSSEHAVKMIGMSCCLAVGVSGVWLYHWRCPRCRRWFFRGWLGVKPFARRCVHCGLPKWSLESPAAYTRALPASERRRGVHPFSARAFFGRRRD